MRTGGYANDENKVNASEESRIFLVPYLIEDRDDVRVSEHLEILTPRLKKGRSGAQSGYFPGGYNSN